MLGVENFRGLKETAELWREIVRYTVSPSATRKLTITCFFIRRQEIYRVVTYFVTAPIMLLLGLCATLRVVGACVDQGGSGIQGSGAVFDLNLYVFAFTFTYTYEYSQRKNAFA